MQSDTKRRQVPTPSTSLWSYPLDPSSSAGEILIHQRSFHSRDAVKGLVRPKMCGTKSTTGGPTWAPHPPVCGPRSWGCGCTRGRGQTVALCAPTFQESGCVFTHFCLNRVRVFIIKHHQRGNGALSDRGSGSQTPRGFGGPRGRPVGTAHGPTGGGRGPTAIDCLCPKIE